MTAYLKTKELKETSKNNSKEVLIVLKDERPVSWNKLLGMHWAKRNDEKQRVWQTVRYSVLTKILDGIFDIEVKVFFKFKPYDSDNIPVKFYVDGLVGELLRDDSPQFVRSTKTISEVDKDNPRVEIRLFRVK